MGSSNGQSAWGNLEGAGLTSYSDAVEESRVWARLLTLASIYWSFCHHGCDEEFGWDDLYCHGTEHLELRPLRLGQLVGPAFDADDYSNGEFDLVESALRHLIEQERPAIVAALHKGFGDEWRLLKALFATTKLLSDPQDNEDLAPDDDDPDFTPAARVMGWIMEGMPSL